MNEELKSLIDQYCEAFLSREHVKKYFALEKMITESKEIEAKQVALKTAQKNLALSLGDDQKHKEALLIYENAKKDFDEDPLIWNYRLLQEQILIEIESLRDKLNAK